MYDLEAGGEKPTSEERVITKYKIQVVLLPNTVIPKEISNQQ
jgi:hypothetical protein